MVVQIAGRDGNMQVEYKWTDGNSKDFHRFYLSTEAYYSNVVGGLKNRQAFVPYNLSETISYVIIAYIGDIAVGCAGLKAYSEHDAEIKWVWVEQDYRRNHIAEDMINRIEKKAKEITRLQAKIDKMQKEEDILLLLRRELKLRQE